QPRPRDGRPRNMPMRATEPNLQPSSFMTTRLLSTHRPKGGAMAVARHSVFRALIPLFLFVLCAWAPAGCACGPDGPPTPTQGIVARRSKRPRLPPTSRGTPGITTASAGSIAGGFGVTSAGEPIYVIPLATVPGRAGVEPSLALTYDGASDG